MLPENQASPASPLSMPDKPTKDPLTYRLNATQPELPILKDHLNLGGANPLGQTLTASNYYLLKNGQPYIPVMGEFHFSRYNSRFWEEELLKMKAGGIDIVATYVFWIHIEEEEGIFEWTGNNDLRQFVSLCAKHGLQAIARIGPFAHGECRNGGLPDWLYGRPFPVRTNDLRFLVYVERLYRQIAQQLKGLLYKDGGCVIGIQIENEYMHAGAPWETTFKQGTEWIPSGSGGIDYLKLLKQLAIDVGLEVPLYTCTGWLNSPIIERELLPMQGGYVFTPWSPDPNYRQPPTREFIFRNRHLNPILNGAATYHASQYPYACCEIGGGIQDTYYHRNIVPTAAVEGLTVMNLAGGANIIGYYMYHGGTHPVGKHSSMNEFTVPRLSYDFQAPLREYGQVAPSYRCLRLLHHFLNDFGELLAPMSVMLPDNAAMITPEDATSLRWAARVKDGAGFLFLNNYQDHVEMHDLTDIRLAVQTADDTITLPTTGGLTLAKDVIAILPFGLTLDGIRLRYATTQLFTKLTSTASSDYFFFAPLKMVSEYAFEAASYATIRVHGGQVIADDNMTYVTVTPGLDCMIELTNDAGRTARFFTLTREQAEWSTKYCIGKKTRLVITPATLVASEDDDALYHVGQDDLDVWMYPPVASNSVADGFFTRFTLKTPLHHAQIEVQMIESNKARVVIPPDLLKDVHNVYLRIDYLGDIGNAFIDGKLVSDNFYNGSVWEIGLKHFADQLREHELFIMITPISSGGTSVGYVPTGMAFQQVIDQEGVAAIHSIDAVSEFKLPLASLMARTD